MRAGTESATRRADPSEAASLGTGGVHEGVEHEDANADGGSGEHEGAEHEGASGSGGDGAEHEDADCLFATVDSGETVT